MTAFSNHYCMSFIQYVAIICNLVVILREKTAACWFQQFVTVNYIMTNDVKDIWCVVTSLDLILRTAHLSFLLACLNRRTKS